MQLYSLLFERVRWFWGLTCDFWAENAEKNCKGKNNGKNKGNIQSLRPLGFAPAFGRAVAIGLILRRFSPWTVLGLVLSPEKSGRRYAMKMERYLLLALVVAVLLVIGSFLATTEIH
jgi:hypothetical protein